MMEQEEQRSEFSDVKERLEEIARLVADDNMPLDDALDLYEEAVKLGLKASDLLETGIVVEEEPVEGEPVPDEAASGEAAAEAVVSAEEAVAGASEETAVSDTVEG